MTDWEHGRGRGGRTAGWLALVVVAIVAAALALDGGAVTATLTDGGDIVVRREGVQREGVQRDGSAPLPDAPGRRGTAFSPPAPGRWATLPPAPIGSRIGHVVADLDGQVIVWGGYQQGRPLDNGALLDPESGTWSTIDPAPATQRRHVPVAGRRTLYLLDERDPMAFSLDGGWSRLPRPPVDAATRLTRVAAWTGRVAAVATVRSDGAAGPLLAWDAVRERWLVLDAPPGAVTDDMALVWDARDLLLLGDTGTGFAHRLPVGDRNLPTADTRWRRMAPPDLPADVLGRVGVRALSSGSVRAGDPVYVWLGPRAATDDGALLLTYRGPTHADSGGWSQLDQPPLDLGAPELVLADDTVVALGPMGAVALVRGSRTPREVATPAVPPFQQRDAAASRGLVVWWGGGAGDGAVWRPHDAARSAAREALVCRDREPVCPYGVVLR